MSFLKNLFTSKPKYVHVEPGGEEFEVPGGQTILEAALAQNIPYPHDCTVGTCGSCKTLLTEGRVRALNDFGYTLSQDELAAGYILACQALPKDEITRVKLENPATEGVEPEDFEGRVAATEPLTHDIVKLTVALDRPLHYIAGQYANIKVPQVGRERHYSFAQPPLKDGRDEVSFFVRKIPGGAFTEALFAGEYDCQALVVNAPQGHFHLRQGDGPMLCIAGGSGLAPVLALLEAARKNRVQRDCVFLFGARTQADLYCLDRIREVEQGWKGRFEFHPVLSEEPEDSGWAGKRGLVTEHVAASLPDADWSRVQGYMCGPPPMIDAGIHAMVELGTPLPQIYHDKFTDESHGAKHENA
ncbi:MAG: monooxygenase [Salinisphaeraceae bacterium]|nr:monooxygenase [Salinisphaeraceae bacterium]